MATLTLQTLIDKDACSDQVELFRSLFGDSVEVTPEACEKVAAQFDFEWAARALLTGPAWAEYERVRDSAWAEYERVRDSAWAEYKRVWDSAWAEYKRVWDYALAEYKRVCDSARAEYERVCARAFGAAYCGVTQ